MTNVKAEPSAHANAHPQLASPEQAAALVAEQEAVLARPIQQPPPLPHRAAAKLLASRLSSFAKYLEVRNYEHSNKCIHMHVNRT